MVLSKKMLSSIKGENLAHPSDGVFSLPEKVLQFGTGVLLRGLIDDFIDKANRKGIFNGRIVVVKSTNSGGADAFATQDGLFTHLIKGIEDGEKVDTVNINASISRVLSANEEWDKILEVATDPNVSVIVSNTTEVGISLVPDDKVDAAPPVSFPGKLLAVLLKRYESCGGNPDAGFVVIPTELLVDNGPKLLAIVLQLASNNGLSKEFMEWVINANDFCSSLVDRIVPGKPAAQEKASVEEALGYTDDLMIMSESYRLWAIETKLEKTKNTLSFHLADPAGVALADNIQKFRELKLRLLNGTHTYSCALAIAGGFKTVKEAMQSASFNKYITTLSNLEMAPCIVGESISTEEATDFANKVLDRFRNPFIEHQWLSISVQYTSKMKMRNVPLILKHYADHGNAPEHMALGFAAYLLFMRSTKNSDGKYEGNLGGKPYLITDDQAAALHKHWNEGPTESVLKNILADLTLWETDLSILNGFTASILAHVNSLETNGFEAMVASV